MKLIRQKFIENPKSQTQLEIQRWRTLEVFAREWMQGYFTMREGVAGSVDAEGNDQEEDLEQDLDGMESQKSSPRGSASLSPRGSSSSLGSSASAMSMREILGWKVSSKNSVKCGQQEPPSRGDDDNEVPPEESRKSRTPLDALQSLRTGLCRRQSFKKAGSRRHSSKQVPSRRQSNAAETGNIGDLRDNETNRKVFFKRGHHEEQNFFVSEHAGRRPSGDEAPTEVQPFDGTTWAVSTTLTGVMPVVPTSDIREPLEASADLEEVKEVDTKMQRQEDQNLVVEEVQAAEDGQEDNASDVDFAAVSRILKTLAEPADGASLHKEEALVEQRQCLPDQQSTVWQAHPADGESQEAARRMWEERKAAKLAKRKNPGGAMRYGQWLRAQTESDVLPNALLSQEASASCSSTSCPPVASPGSARSQAALGQDFEGDRKDVEDENASDMSPHDSSQHVVSDDAMDSWKARKAMKKATRANASTGYGAFLRSMRDFGDANVSHASAPVDQMRRSSASEVVSLDPPAVPVAPHREKDEKTLRRELKSQSKLLHTRYADRDQKRKQQRAETCSGVGTSGFDIAAEPLGSGWNPSSSSCFVIIVSPPEPPGSGWGPSSSKESPQESSSPTGESSPCSLGGSSQSSPDLPRADVQSEHLAPDVPGPSGQHQAPDVAGDPKSDGMLDVLPVASRSRLSLDTSRSQKTASTFSMSALKRSIISYLPDLSVSPATAKVAVQDPADEPQLRLTSALPDSGLSTVVESLETSRRGSQLESEGSAWGHRRASVISTISTSSTSRLMAGGSFVGKFIFGTVMKGHQPEAEVLEVHEEENSEDESSSDDPTTEEHYVDKTVKSHSVEELHEAIRKYQKARTMSAVSAASPTSTAASPTSPRLHRLSIAIREKRQSVFQTLASNVGSAAESAAVAFGVRGETVEPELAEDSAESMTWPGVNGAMGPSPGDWLLPQHSIMRMVTTQVTGGDSSNNEQVVGKGLKASAFQQRLERSKTRERLEEEEELAKKEKLAKKNADGGRRKSVACVFGSHDASTLHPGRRSSYSGFSGSSVADSNWSEKTSDLLERELNEVAKDRETSIEEMLQWLKNTESGPTLKETADVRPATHAEPQKTSQDTSFSDDDSGLIHQAFPPTQELSHSATEEASMEERKKKWKERHNKKLEKRKERMRVQSGGTAKAAWSQTYGSKSSGGGQNKAMLSKEVWESNHSDSSWASSLLSSGASSVQSHVTERSLAVRAEDCSMRKRQNDQPPAESKPSSSPEQRIWS